MDRSSRTMIGSLRQTMTKGVTPIAAWAYEVVDALGRCWFLILATLSVGITIAFVPQGREALWAASGPAHAWQVWAFLVTSTLGAVLVTLFAAQILESRREGEIAGSGVGTRLLFLGRSSLLVGHGIGVIVVVRIHDWLSFFAFGFSSRGFSVASFGWK